MFPGAGLGTKKFGSNQKTWGTRVLGVARSGEENGGFSSRRSWARVTNVSGKEFGIDTGGVGGRVMVNFRRSNVWGNETVVVCVGIGRNPGRSGPARGRERSR